MLLRTRPACPLVALYYGRVEAIWSPGLMTSGRRHDDLTATSIELGYTDCRELYVDCSIAIAWETFFNARLGFSGPQGIELLGSMAHYKLLKRS